MFYIIFIITKFSNIVTKIVYFIVNIGSLIENALTIINKGTIQCLQVHYRIFHTRDLLSVYNMINIYW